MKSCPLTVDALLYFSGQDRDAQEFRCTLKHNAGGQFHLNSSAVLVLDGVNDEGSTYGEGSTSVESFNFGIKQKRGNQDAMS